MEDSFLKKIYQTLVHSMSRDLGLYRVLGLMAVVFIPLFGVVLPEGAYDPWGQRLALSAYFAVVTGLSLVLPIIQNNIRHVAHFSMYLIVVWSIQLVYRNAFLWDYLVMYFVVLTYAGVSFTSLRAVVVFALFNLLVVTVAVIFFSVNPWALAMTSGILLVTILLVGYRITIQRELNRHQDLMGSIYQDSPDAIFLADPKSFRTVDCNASAVRMFRAEGKIGPLHKHITAWLNAHQRGQSFAVGEGIRIEQDMTALDGVQFWADIAVARVQVAGTERLLIRVTDVSDKKMVEDKLRLSDYILQKVEQLVFVANEKAEILYISPHLRQILGYDPDAMLGEGWWEMRARSGIDVAEHRNYIIDCISGAREPRNVAFEQEIQDSEGISQWVSWRESVTSDRLMIAVATLANQERRNRQVQSAIFSIAEASSIAQSPFEFYRDIHQQILTVIDTPNFYIAVYDEDNDEVSFPYYTDLTNQVAQDRIGRKRKAGKGLTEYTIRRKQPLLLSKAEILKIDATGAIQVAGQAIPESWLGIPMVHNGEAVGLITIQDYHRPDAFTNDDLSLVSFIANQVAQFVNKLQADEQLKLSEERFRAIYDRAAVGIARISSEDGFTQVNQRMTEIFGYRAEEFFHKKPQEIAHPSDKEVGYDDLVRIYRGEIDSYSTEKRYLHKNGSTLHILVSVSASRVNEEVDFIIAVYEDITEKKRAQEETELLLTLSTELQNSHSAQDALNLGMIRIAQQGEWDYGEIWWADLNLQLRYCDSYFVTEGGLEAFHEQSREMVRGKDPDFSPVKSASGAQITWHSDLAELGDFGRRDLALANGFRSAVFISLQENGQSLGVIILMRKAAAPPNEGDFRLFKAAGSQLIGVIQRLLAEAAQRESEARFRAITETAFEGIVIHRNGVILEVNSAFASIFGHSVEEMMQRQLQSLVYEEAPEAWLVRISTDAGKSVEFTGRRADGEAIFLEAVSRRDTWRAAPANILAVRDITHQKVMEEAREAARIDARFRAYVQNSSEIVQIADVDGTVSYCSPSMERITGHPHEAMIGKHIFAQFHPDNQATIDRIWGGVVATPNESGRFQARFRHASGEWLELQTSLVNLVEDPLVRGILISSRDITDVLRAQRSMTESEERFRTLFALSPDAIFVESRGGYVLDVNEAGCKLHEMSREEIIGKHVTDLAPEEDRERVISSFERLFTGETSYIEAMSISRSGLATPVEVRVNVIQFQGEQAIILQARDITERKQSELVLKESEERFRALVEHATEAIFVQDVENETFLEVNKNAEVLFGKSRTVLMSTRPWELSPAFQPDGALSRERMRELMDRAVQGEQLVIEWTHRHASGKHVPCEIRLNRFPSSSQVLVRGSITDITERKLAEQRILESQERLRIQNEKLIDLAASPAINTGALDAAYREITQGICETLQVHHASIWLFNEERTHLECQMQFNAELDLFGKGKQLQTAALPAYLQALQEERVISGVDATQDSRTREFSENFLLPNGFVSVLDAPLRHSQMVAGVVRIAAVDRQEWSQETQNFAGSMADMVTLSLEAWERKRAEEKLEQTFSKMRATFDSTRDGILVVDTEGNVLEYNDAFLGLSNIPREILDSGQPNPGYEIMLENIVARQAFMEAMDNMEQNPDLNLRHIFRLRDGRVAEVYVRPMRVGGELRGRLWFLHDITEIKRAEEAVLESEAKFRTLFSQANDAILVMNGDRISDCNEKALDMYGLRAEQLKGKAFYELSPPIQPDGSASDGSLWEHLDEVFKGESVSFTWKHRRANGRPFDAEVSLNQVRIGDNTFVQAFVRDITERVRAERALRDSERKNKAILDAIPDLMLRISGDGIILDYKTSDQQTLLMGNGTVLDHHLAQVLPDSMVQKALASMKTALGNGETQQYELEMEIEGDLRDFETRLVRSGPREALVIIRDVTERKRTEKELIKRNFELDSFVYRASHDLKAPLNSLMGLIDLVGVETTEESVLRYLTMMNKSVVKLDTFIRDLADFSRNARQELQASVIDWEGIIRETLENLQFMENADQVEKLVSIDSQAPFQSDPVRLGIILNNLVSNAVKYQDLRKDRRQVEISVCSDDQHAVIRIADNGIGIPEKYHAKVFDLFFRASIQSYGSGIGMYIVRNAIDKLHGDITLDSKEGRGTTFELRIPNIP